MCHTDLKSENMLSDPSGNIRLIDFSQAMFLEDVVDVYQKFKVPLVPLHIVAYSRCTSSASQEVLLVVELRSMF